MFIKYRQKKKRHESVVHFFFCWRFYFMGWLLSPALSPTLQAADWHLTGHAAGHKGSRSYIKIKISATGLHLQQASEWFQPDIHHNMTTRKVNNRMQKTDSGKHTDCSNIYEKQKWVHAMMTIGTGWYDFLRAWQTWAKISCFHGFTIIALSISGFETATSSKRRYTYKLLTSPWLYEKELRNREEEPKEI